MISTLQFVIQCKSEDGSVETPVYMSVIDRANDVYLDSLGDILQRKKDRRINTRQPLLSKHLHHDLQEYFSVKPDIYKALFSTPQDERVDSDDGEVSVVKRLI